MTGNSFRVQNKALREFFGELLGTFTLTCLGCSVNAYLKVAKEGEISHAVGPLGWGMALTAAIYVTGGVSGGHVNPAVSMGLASVGKLPWKKLGHYMVAQYLGAFLAAVVTFCVYYDAIVLSYGADLKTSGPNATAGIFGTYPTGDISTGACFLDQIVATGMFLLIINAMTDKNNMNCPKGLIPIAIGLTNLGVIEFAFGYNCGGAVNPARDLAPRLFTLMAGYGNEVFSFRNYNYFWVPLIGTHIGGILGSWIYVLLIENHWPDDQYDVHEMEDMNGSPTEVRSIRKMQNKVYSSSNA